MAGWHSGALYNLIPNNFPSFQTPKVIALHVPNGLVYKTFYYSTLISFRGGWKGLVLLSCGPIK